MASWANWSLFFFFSNESCSLLWANVVSNEVLQVSKKTVRAFGAVLILWLPLLRIHEWKIYLACDSHFLNGHFHFLNSSCASENWAQPGKKPPLKLHRKFKFVQVMESCKEKYPFQPIKSTRKKAHLQRPGSFFSPSSYLTDHLLFLMSWCLLWSLTANALSQVIIFPTLSLWGNSFIPMTGT